MACPLEEAVPLEQKLAVAAVLVAQLLAMESSAQAVLPAKELPAQKMRLAVASSAQAVLPATELPVQKVRLAMVSTVQTRALVLAA